MKTLLILSSLCVCCAAMRLPIIDSQETEQISDGEDTFYLERPRNRSQCIDGPRPCPWVGCKFNLFLDVRADGVLRLNFPGQEIEELLNSCALDLAEHGPRTLEQVALIMGMSKERARQLEDSAFTKLKTTGHVMREHIVPTEWINDGLD
jgi:hypothetical protein